MAEIRLSKLTKQFSIGLARLVEFLNEKGANVEMNPNAKVSDEYLPAIEAKFGEDQKLKKDSEKVTIKLKEIIEMGAKKKTSVEEEDIPEREVVIKSNVLNEERPVEEAPVEKPQPAPAPAPACLPRNRAGFPPPVTAARRNPVCSCPAGPIPRYCPMSAKLQQNVPPADSSGGTSYSGEIPCCPRAVHCGCPHQ